MQKLRPAYETSTYATHSNIPDLCWRISEIRLWNIRKSSVKHNSSICILCISMGE